MAVLRLRGFRSIEGPGLFSPVPGIDRAAAVVALQMRAPVEAFGLPGGAPNGAPQGAPPAAPYSLGRPGS